MALTNLLNKIAPVPALAVGVGVLAGCASTGGYQPAPNGVREQVVAAPAVTQVQVSDFGQYGSGKDVQMPKYSQDGGGYFIPSMANYERGGVLRNNYEEMRPNAKCHPGYTLQEDVRLDFQDGSFCFVDVCTEEVPPQPVPRVPARQTYAPTYEYGGNDGGDSDDGDNGGGPPGGGRGVSGGMTGDNGVR